MREIGQAVATSRRQAANLLPAMTKFKTVLASFALAISGSAAAQGLLGPASNEDQFLHVDKAFVFGASADGGDRLRLDWQIAPGYYLYRHRVSVKTATAGFTLGALAMPDGHKKTDEFFGDVEVYYDFLSATVPVARLPDVTAPIEITVSYQGCADAGLCYPPVTKTVSVQLPAAGTPAPGADPPGGGTAMVSEQDSLADLITGGSLFAVILKFFGWGLVLAFTPCVLPMIPILSGIIAGQGESATPARSFLLSVVYVLGMALTYAIAGAAFAAAGQQAQAFFQQPWIIISFAALFVVLALAMFGLYDLKIPSALETRLAGASGRQRSGTFAGTAIMGVLSALVVSACVAPPMVAALAVIGQKGEILRGAIALFAMAIGMGSPLLVVGAGGGRFLPHAGPWMTTIKALFGVLFLGVAVWMLSRVLPGTLTLALWALLVIVGGYYFGGFGRASPSGDSGGSSRAASDSQRSSGESSCWSARRPAGRTRSSRCAVRACPGSPARGRPRGQKRCLSERSLRSRTSTGNSRPPRQPASPRCSISMRTGASPARRWRSTPSPCPRFRRISPASCCSRRT